MNKLTDIRYWETIQGKPCIELEDNNIIKVWIEENINITALNSCIEIGCYPGRYLSIFGNHGIELNGIDYLSEVSSLAALYSNNGYRVGKFYCLDFHEDTIKDQFDCVFSLGFIEHFSNWQNVFIKHFDLVADGGLLIIEVPNFRGWMQRLPRLIFDRKNYLRHNIKSMDLEIWIDILKKNNFEILKAEAIGGYLLWFERPCGKVELVLRGLFVKFMRLVKGIFYQSQINDVSFSGALIIVARKK